jgi:hypothetical protein
MLRLVLCMTLARNAYILWNAFRVLFHKEYVLDDVMNNMVYIT